MAQFAKLSYLGHARINLDEVPSDCDEFEAGFFYELIEESEHSEQNSEAETIPGSPKELRNRMAIELDSESEVEVVEVFKVLSPEEEQLRMQGEEKWGFLLRLEHKNELVESRIQRLREAKEQETREQRLLRRGKIREHLARSD